MVAAPISFTKESDLGNPKLIHNIHHIIAAGGTQVATWAQIFTKREPKISEFIFLLPIRLVTSRGDTSRIGSKNINYDIFGSLFVKI